MRSQRPFQFDVLRSLSCLAHSNHLPPSHPPLFLSIYLLFSLSRRFASLHGLVRSACPSFSLPRVFLFVHPSLFLFFLRVPFAKLRSIFHLELRRSLAINPRIHYGLRGPYCSFFATSARCLLARRFAFLPACLPACLPAPVIGFASLRFAGPPRRSRRVVFRVCDDIPGHWSDASFRKYRRNSFVRCRPFGAYCSYVSESSRAKYMYMLL